MSASAQKERKIEKSEKKFTIEKRGRHPFIIFPFIRMASAGQRRSGKEAAAAGGAPPPPPPPPTPSGNREPRLMTTPPPGQPAAKKTAVTEGSFSTTPHPTSPEKKCRSDSMSDCVQPGMSFRLVPNRKGLLRFIQDELQGTGLIGQTPQLRALVKEWANTAIASGSTMQLWCMSCKRSVYVNPNPNAYGDCYCLNNANNRNPPADLDFRCLTGAFRKGEALGFWESVLNIQIGVLRSFVCDHLVSLPPTDAILLAKRLECNAHRIQLSWLTKGTTPSGFANNEMSLTYKCAGSCRFRKTFNFSETAIYPAETAAQGFMAFDDDGELPALE